MRLFNSYIFYISNVYLSVMRRNSHAKMGPTRYGIGGMVMPLHIVYELDTPTQYRVSLY
jgi:hypothetical protein